MGKKEDPLGILQAEFPHPLADLEEAVAANVASAKSPATLRAYRSDWKTFSSWCDGRGLLPMPAHPRVIAAYVSWLDAAQGRSIATITRAMSSISQAHQVSGHAPPTQDPLVRATMQGIKRTRGTAQRAAVPLLPRDLRGALPEWGKTKRQARDRSLLCLGLAGGLRAGELVALQVADVVEVNEGLVLTIRFSKTDQEGRGRRIGIAWGTGWRSCPVRATTAWIDESGIEDGPLLRSVNEADVITDRPIVTKTVTRAVRRVLREAGLDPKGYSSHSLRSGFITAAAAAGKRMDRIMQQTGHRSVEVMQGYIREATLFEDNPSQGIGL